MKLSKRLNEIHNMVENNYDHIWDCCCDHGFLGAKLLTSQQLSTVHFVDIVPELMIQLESKLLAMNKQEPQNLLYKTHCIDVAQLPLREYTGKHLVIISGVGGDLMSSFIKAIAQQHANLTIDFLLCPVRHLYTLRNTLIDLNYSMKYEKLVEDNKRFYEIMLVSTQKNSHKHIAIAGDDIWLSESEQQAIVAKRYLQQTLAHYQRVEKSNKINVGPILKAYQAISL